jgi:hypothetical protein
VLVTEPVIEREVLLSEGDVRLRQSRSALRVVSSSLEQLSAAVPLAVVRIANLQPGRARFSSAVETLSRSRTVE